VAKFYSARSKTIPPLPWQTFALPFSSVGEILEGALGIEPAKWTKGDQMRVGAWLKSRDWERYRSGAGATREWRYRKPQGGG
jgi:hypothetical protein